ncbi:hypothetical protein F5887DRAFT_948216 [Amanita rubescens]|nr:hypothetical protein F5887DRAFT_948216 [Amanita rubescens]
MDLTIKPQHISEMKENLNDLPTEILSHIFNLAAQDHGPVYFPISKQNRSPQLVISHVCSHWRRVALCTPELWSDTLLAYSGPGRVIDLHEQWLLRAGNSPVTLSIRFPHLLDGDEVASALQRISLPFQVKRLFLDLMYEQFEKLSNLPETTLSDLAVLELDISLPDDGDVNIRPLHFITRLQSLTLSGEQSLDVWFDKLSAILPWSQLRSVDVRNIGSANLHPIVDILRQIPMLQRLNLYLNERRIDVFETLTMPYLRDFQLVIAMERREFDKVLRCFTCPSLEKFTLSSNTTSWTFQTTVVHFQFSPFYKMRLCYARFLFHAMLYWMIQPLMVYHMAFLDDISGGLIWTLYTMF